MNDKQDAPELVIVDLGKASDLTKGLPFQTPWIENSPPPFNNYCPVCG